MESIIDRGGANSEPGTDLRPRLIGSVPLKEMDSKLSFTRIYPGLDRKRPAISPMLSTSRKSDRLDTAETIRSLGLQLLLGQPFERPFQKWLGYKLVLLAKYRNADRAFQWARRRGNPGNKRRDLFMVLHIAVLVSAQPRTLTTAQRRRRGLAKARNFWNPKKGGIDYAEKRWDTDARRALTALLASAHKLGMKRDQVLAELDSGLQLASKPSGETLLEFLDPENDADIRMIEEAMRHQEQFQD